MAGNKTTDWSVTLFSFLGLLSAGGRDSSSAGQVEGARKGQDLQPVDFTPKWRRNRLSEVQGPALPTLISQPLAKEREEHSGNPLPKGTPTVYPLPSPILSLTLEIFVK